MWKQIDFELTTLGHRVGRGNQINASEIKATGRFPVIDQGQNFIAGYSDDKSKLVVDDLPYIIFGDHTRCFKFVDFPFILGADGTKVIKPDVSLFDPKFYFYALRSLDIPNRGYNRHFSLLRERKVPRPELDEQRVISSVLTTVETAIIQQERLIAAMHELKSELRRKLFSEGLCGEKQKETEVGLVPESWQVGPLKRFCDVLTSSMSYTQLEQTDDSYDENAVVVMGIKVSDMNLPGNETRILSANLHRKLELSLARHKTVPTGTIVFPKRGAAIATNKKRLTTTWTVLDPNLIGVKPGELLDTQFLYQWFGLFDLRTITDPGPTPQLNKKDLEPLSLPVPSDLNEQVKIASLLTIVDESIDLHREKRLLLEELFRSLLHQLMTGQARVNDLDLPTLQ